MALPDDFDLDEFVQRVLAEDLGSGGDVTSRATIAEDARFTAEMNARQAIVVAGIEIAAGVLPRARPRKCRSNCSPRTATRVERGHDADAPCRQCPRDARRRAFRRSTRSSISPESRR